MKEEEFVPYNLSLALKELGFDDFCFDSYEPKGLMGQQTSNSAEWIKHNPKCCSAPLWQQAFRWFRKKYEILFEFNYFTKNYNHKTDPIMWEYSILCKPYYKGNYIHDEEDGFYTYEKAEVACLEKLIEIVKNK